MYLLCRDGGAYFESWGLTSGRRRRERLGGIWGNPPPENFEILKLGNATFITEFFIICMKLGGSSPPAPRLRRPCSDKGLTLET